jgi:hypothetical protein
MHCQNKQATQPAAPHWRARRPVYGLGITSDQARKNSLCGIFATIEFLWRGRLLLMRTSFVLRTPIYS